MHIEGDDHRGTVDRWRRVRLLRAFLFLMIPVVALSAVSYLLWRATAQSTPETYADIHFWFYFFDVGREINVPTWFSAGLWILIGVLAGYHARHAARFRVSWGFFSFVAVFLSLDETLELHERLDVLGNELSRYVPVQLGFTWVIPGVLIAGVLCAILLRLVLSLPRTVMAGLIASGVVFVSGSVGAETLSGLALVNGGAAPSFFVLTLIEETLEMTGLALCLASLLHVVEHRRVDGGVAYRTAASRRTVAAPADEGTEDQVEDQAGDEAGREASERAGDRTTATPAAIPPPPVTTSTTPTPTTPTPTTPTPATPAPAATVPGPPPGRMSP